MINLIQLEKSLEVQNSKKFIKQEMKSVMKIYTSFVTKENWEKCIKDDLLPIIIIRNLKNSDLLGGFSETCIHKSELSPSNALFRQKRAGEITIEEFKNKFKEELSNINLSDIISKFEYLAKVSNAKGIVLFSYGQDYNSCHRSVVADVLNNSGLLDNKVGEINFNNSELYGGAGKFSGQ